MLRPAPQGGASLANTEAWGDGAKGSAVELDVEVVDVVVGAVVVPVTVGLGGFEHESASGRKRQTGTLPKAIR
jgi:hypothetical protein